MKRKIFFPIILYIFLSTLSSCSKTQDEIKTINETSQELEMISFYKDGFNALKSGDYYFASKKFLDAELLYPQSIWAPKSSLMAAYSYYMNGFYEEAIQNSERYIKTYPNDVNIIYAHYLIAMCYYQNIEGEKKDSNSLVQAKKKFNYIIKNYPDSEFSLDAKFKVDLITDILASKEMYLGRYYQKKGKWIAATNRFKEVVNKYDQTIFIEEALYRLVETYYKLGLKNESKKYAQLLGYNYLSSQWYKKSYKMFNQDYSITLNDKIKKNEEGVLEKFKKLF